MNDRLDFYKAGTAWTREDDQYLIDRFAAHASLEELCRLHGRTPSSICARLVEHGCLVVQGRSYRRVGETFTTFDEISALRKEGTA